MTSDCHDDVCITCSDQLLRVRVTAVAPDGMTATGECDGEEVEVSVELLEGVRIGDILLSHGGVGLQHAPASEVTM